MQKETIVFFLDNKFKFSSAVLIFSSRSMVALAMSNPNDLLSQKLCRYLNS